MVPTMSEAVVLGQYVVKVKRIEWEMGYYTIRFVIEKDKRKWTFEVSNKTNEVQTLRFLPSVVTDEVKKLVPTILAKLETVMDIMEVKHRIAIDVD